jgi:hypothetical protein
MFIAHSLIEFGRQADGRLPNADKLCQNYDFTALQHYKI